MAVIVQYNPASTPVANRVTKILKSGDTSQFVGQPNTLINPVLPSGAQVSNTKVTGGTTVEFLTVADNAAINAANTAEQAAARLALYETLKAEFDSEGERAIIMLKAQTLTMLDLMNNTRSNAGLSTVTPAQFKTFFQDKLESLK